MLSGISSETKRGFVLGSGRASFSLVLSGISSETYSPDGVTLDISVFQFSAFWDKL